MTPTHLTANVCLARPYKESGPPKGRLQNGSKLLKLNTKVAKAPITRKIGKMALNELPDLCEKGTSKIKNKKN